MQNKVTQDKEFCTLCYRGSPAKQRIELHKSKTINELINGGSGRLGELKRRSERRSRTLDYVRAALPPALAASVVSAEIDAQRLTVGVAGAAWAARLRYAAESLRIRVSEAMDTPLAGVRIRVVPSAR